MLYIIEVNKKGKWSPLIEIGGRLHIAEITTVFRTEKDAKHYAKDYFCEEDDSFIDAWRVSSIEPLEVQR